MLSIIFVDFNDISIPSFVITQSFYSFIFQRIMNYLSFQNCLFRQPGTLYYQKYPILLLNQRFSIQIITYPVFQLPNKISTYQFFYGIMRKISFVVGPSPFKLSSKIFSSWTAFCNHFAMQKSELLMLLTI